MWTKPNESEISKLPNLFQTFRRNISHSFAVSIPSTLLPDKNVLGKSEKVWFRHSIFSGEICPRSNFSQTFPRVDETGRNCQISQTVQTSNSNGCRNSCVNEWKLWEVRTFIFFPKLSVRASEIIFNVRKLGRGGESARRKIIAIAVGGFRVFIGFINLLLTASQLDNWESITATRKDNGSQCRRVLWGRCRQRYFCRYY